MTTAYQDERFIAAVISKTLLEESIEWIASHLSPEDVFDEKALRNWAESYGMVEKA